MCSRTKDKAQRIVDSLKSGSGYTEKVMQGNIAVPPSPEAGEWRLRAGCNADAANADLIVLGTAYEQAWPLLEALSPQIRGKGKMILDITNPFLKRPDGMGAGLPKDGPQSGIEVHKLKLDDESVKWAGAYKSVLWTLVLPSGPKNPSRPDIEVFGDLEAVEVVSTLIRDHGWRPIVRGGLEVAKDYEGGIPSLGKIVRNIFREITRGEKLSVGW
jgi:predicted dinucleotide-binding enzyme